MVAESDADTRIIQLLVKSGPDKGRMYFVKPKKEAVIGCAPSADLRLTDPDASQKHCLIRLAGDMVFVDDLGGGKGTFIDGESVVSRVLDEDGQIEIGSSVIELIWVKTNSEIPLGTVQSADAPTLLMGDSPFKMIDPPVKVKREVNIFDPGKFEQYRSAGGMLGRIIGGYLLLEVAGIGEMGIVYRAKQIKTREQAALKVIPHSSVRGQQLLTRFLMGTRVGLKISGAANVIATGEDGKYAYIAMELARGVGLQASVRSGRKFDPKPAVKLFCRLCETLQEAHALGIVHRNIKPSSILLGPDQVPVLLDLGLAKKTDSEGKSIFIQAEPVLASTSQDILENMAYLSPEMSLEARDIDARADIYSLAAALYFTLGRQPPFTADSPLALVRMVRRNDATPLRELNKDVTILLSGVIARAMAKSKDERFENMKEFGKTLQRAVAE